MRERHLWGFAVLVATLLAGQAAAPAFAQDPAPHAAAAGAAPVGDVVAGLYTLVSATGGTMPDWDKVRALFLKEAVIVLRTSRTTLTPFSLEGFIKKVVRMKVWEFGDMAHVLVLYEAMITGFPMAPQQGIDSWLLVRRDGRWLIAAATNELVTAARPIPPELR